VVVPARSSGAADTAEQARPAGPAARVARSAGASGPASAAGPAGPAGAEHQLPVCTAGPTNSARTTDAGRGRRTGTSDAARAAVAPAE
jgi:hypothetical protein